MQVEISRSTIYLYVTPPIFYTHTCRQMLSLPQILELKTLQANFWKCKHINLTPKLFLAPKNLRTRIMQSAVPRQHSLQCIGSLERSCDLLGSRDLITKVTTRLQHTSLTVHKFKCNLLSKQQDVTHKVP